MMDEFECLENARRFFSELLYSVESFAELEKQVGALVMADIFYFQGAIMAGDATGFDCIWMNGESPAAHIVKNLPSGEKWSRFFDGAQRRKGGRSEVAPEIPLAPV